MCPTRLTPIILIPLPQTVNAQAIRFVVAIAHFP